MKKEEVKKLLFSQAKEVVHNARKVNDHFDKDHIHDFRVAVKTLRAFLRFLHLAAPGDLPSIGKKIKHLYRTAGDIRDAQLESETLDNLGLDVPVYGAFSQQLISGAMKKWKDHYSGSDLDAFTEAIHDDSYENLSPASAGKFFKEKLTVIAGLCRLPDPTEDQIHDIRKEVKDMLYVHKIIRKEWPAALPFAPADETILDEIAHAIGDYHDRVVLVEHLSSFWSDEIHRREQDTIDQFCKDQSVHLAARKKEILGMVRGFVAEGD